jgi:hypothetical protein
VAVLAEAISAIVRVSAIFDHYPDGWTAFVSAVPNSTLCSDNELARVGFMTPGDCKSFIDRLATNGMTFLKDGRSQDIVVADQMYGPTVPCDWADFGRIEINPGQIVPAAQLRGTANRQVFCPDGWNYEGSLSQQFGYVPSGKQDRSLKFLRHEKGVDVYLNVLTDKGVYIGRVNAE